MGIVGKAVGLKYEDVTQNIKMRITKATEDHLLNGNKGEMVVHVKLQSFFHSGVSSLKG